jgi:PAS domain S-box-containing protein
MHRLLERQLRKCFGSLSRLPDSVSRLLEMVDHAYEGFDVERRALEGKNRSLLEESRDAICVTSLDGRTLNLNQAAVRALGLESRESSLDEPVVQFYSDPEQRRALIEELETQGYVDSRELRLRTRRCSLWSKRSARRRAAAAN